VTALDVESAQPRAPSPSPWRPLKNRIFSSLLVANLVSDIGAFMQGVGAAWLMVSFGAGPLKVALIQTATSLPFFILVLPAGALGDIMDRRRLILVTETWMLAAALVLAVVTLLGAMTPWLLLVLTFLLSAGDACEAPSWRALLPELVEREDLASASALNGIEFNLARAAGPALAGLLIASTGVGTAFLLNALSFLGVIVVVARWKRPARRSQAPAETVGGATVAALRYVRHSPPIRTLLLWTGCVIFFASAIMALLPTIAHRLRGGSLDYGLLLAFFGSGAVLGALVMPRLRARTSTAGILSLALAVLSVTLLATGTLKTFWPLCGFLVFGGSAWLIFISIFTTMVQQLAPAWVRARVLAVFLLVFQGSVALGSFVWGWAAEHQGIAFAFVLASAGTAASILLRFLAGLPNVDVDLSPWIHWNSLPSVAELGYGPEDGPVLVTIEYRVNPQRVATFIVAVHRMGRLRRRDGASRWGIYRDTESPDRYLETFIVNSWAEHQRQHERPVRADRAVEEAVDRSAREGRTIRHFLYVDKDR
jgi:MFS family permease